MRPLHIVFDVDGTLEDFHGPVTRELCKKLYLLGATLWLLSKRNDETETPAIVKNYGFQHILSPKGKNYMEIKSTGLEYVKNNVPANSIIVYVGDRAEDFVVALSSRVIFCSPSALSEEIFQDVKVGFATLCGGECGKKVYFEGHLTGMI